jgi:hypothetical protein
VSDHVGLHRAYGRHVQTQEVEGQRSGGVDRSALAKAAHDVHARSVKVADTGDIVGPVLTGLDDDEWDLSSAGFTFTPNAAVGRDKFLASSHEIAVGGTVGVYLFKLRGYQLVRPPPGGRT